MGMGQNAIVLYKGDDSAAFGARTIKIKLTTDLDLTGATAKFSMLSYTKTFTSVETATKEFVLTFSASQAKAFPLGFIFGKLQLYDSTSRVLTASCKIPFEVRLPGSGVGPCKWTREDATSTIDVFLGVDYAYVYNKPTIDGVTVDGDKDAHDYGIAKLSDITQGSSVVEGYYYNGKFYSDAAHTQEIAGASGKIYIDLVTNTQYRWNAVSGIYVKISASIEVDDHLDGDSTNPVQNKVIKSNFDIVDGDIGSLFALHYTLEGVVAGKVAISSLKSAFTDPSNVQLSTKTIRDYLITLYNAIQGIS